MNNHTTAYTAEYISIEYDYLMLLCFLKSIAKTRQNAQRFQLIKQNDGNNGSVAQITDYFTNTNTRFTYDLAERVVSQREYTGTAKNGGTLRSYTDFTYADKTNYLTGIKHFSPLGTQTIGYAYGNQKTGYMPDQVYIVSWNGANKLQNSFDNLGRLQAKFFNNNKEFITKYTYENLTVNNDQRTTTLIKSVITPAGTYTYTYDNIGNITAVTNGTCTASYEYDSLNQLTRVNDEQAGKTCTYSYSNGNITECSEYAYTTGELGEPLSTKTWSYNDSTWSDLLTNYNGTAITYDEIGNPLTMGSKELTWLGRQLQSITDGEDEIAYTYNGDGLRTSKTVNGTTTEYYYNGSILAGQKSSNDTLVFMYDNNSDIFGFVYNGTEYYYIKNAQNDVIAIADKDGNVLVKYEYDAWGKISKITKADGSDITNLEDDIFHHTADFVTGEQHPVLDENGNPVTSASTEVTLARINPILYRSYYYDAETEWYYLNTRYYSPDMCRFINADEYIQTGQGILDKNMFAYCLNNPMNMMDPNGKCPHDGKFYTSGPFKGQFEYNPNCKNCKSHGEFWLKTPDGKRINMMGSESHKYNQMAICTDGGQDALGSKTHQKQTAHTINGEYLDPVKIRYVVAPIKYNNVKNGDLAMVIDHETGKYVMAIVGDRGPEGKFNECSVSIAWDLGYEWADGSRGPSGDFETIYFPN